MSDPTAEPVAATAFNFDAVEGLRVQLLAHAPEAARQSATRGYNNNTSTEPQQVVAGTGDIAGTDMEKSFQDPSNTKKVCDEQPQHKPDDRQNSSAQQNKVQENTTATTPTAAAKSGSFTESNQDQQLVGVDEVKSCHVVSNPISTVI